MVLLDFMTRETLADALEPTIALMLFFQSLVGGSDEAILAHTRKRCKSNKERVMIPLLFSTPSSTASQVRAALAGMGVLAFQWGPQDIAIIE